MTTSIAIVHDWLAFYGGAERTVAFMSEVFPDAPIYTAVYLPARTFPTFRAKTIHTLSGARWARSEIAVKRMFLLWLLGFMRLDLSDYDVVLSSSTHSAKFIRAQNHACYCHAPTRLLWKAEGYTQASLPIGGLAYRLGKLIVPLLRRLDIAQMRRIPRLATSGKNMAAEIKQVYNRQAHIIPPPIRLSDYRLGDGSGQYYLSVARLISHKRIDLIVQACERMSRPLVVVGDGPEMGALKALSKGGTRFLGHVGERQLVDLYANARALIHASHEDFGIAPLEAQAAGRPVIAYGAGGALETVIEGQTGLFFKQQQVDSVAAAIKRFEKLHFDPKHIRDLAARFDVAAFEHDLREFVISGRPASKSL